MNNKSKNSTKKSTILIFDWITKDKVGNWQLCFHVHLRSHRYCFHKPWSLGYSWRHPRILPDGELSSSIVGKLEGVNNSYYGRLLSSLWWLRFHFHSLLFHQFFEPLVGHIYPCIVAIRPSAVRNFIYFFKIMMLQFTNCYLFSSGCWTCEGYYC